MLQQLINIPLMPVYQTLSKLSGFTQALRQEKLSLSHTSVPATAESYHGQLLERDDDDEGAEGSAAWHAGRLKFTKHSDDEYHNAEDRDEYVVIDSRVR